MTRKRAKRNFWFESLDERHTIKLDSALSQKIKKGRASSRTAKCPRSGACLGESRSSPLKTGVLIIGDDSAPALSIVVFRRLECLFPGLLCYHNHRNLASVNAHSIVSPPRRDSPQRRKTMGRNHRLRVNIQPSFITNLINIPDLPCTA